MLFSSVWFLEGLEMLGSILHPNAGAELAPTLLASRLMHATIHDDLLKFFCRKDGWYWVTGIKNRINLQNLFRKNLQNNEGR